MSHLIVHQSGSPILEYNQPALLSSLLTKIGFAPDMPCGGKQRCLKCKVIATGALSPLSAREEQLLTEDEKKRGIRFACMATALGDVEVTLLNQTAHAQIMTDGSLGSITPEPWGKQYGAAIDIGTTTVAAYLYRLDTPRPLQTSAAKNPQAAFGADVISRIERSLAGDAPALAEAIRQCLRERLQELCGRQSLPLSALDSLVITGNTAMLYLLCEQSPASIATAPFEQDRYFGEFLTGADIGLPDLTAQIYLSRCISAYVGGDITTALLASGLAQSEPPSLLVDIGTNGEMVLHANGKLLGCSTAAGPAFEGAGIAMGMPAADGAISRVFATDGGIGCTVIGDVPARGICGSGIVDALAVMLEYGIVDETGCILEEDHAFTAFVEDYNGEPAFRLPDTAVFITQKDIRAIQLGKSAVCAGIETLIQTAGLHNADIAALKIAGGFGSFLNVQSAERIGLIPAGFAAKATAIGNAAAMGASMALLSRSALDESEQLARRTETVELSTSPTFMDAYVNGMLFP